LSKNKEVYQNGDGPHASFHLFYMFPLAVVLVRVAGDVAVGDVVDVAVAEVQLREMTGNGAFDLKPDLTVKRRLHKR